MSCKKMKNHKLDPNSNKNFCTALLIMRQFYEQKQK